MGMPATNIDLIVAANIKVALTRRGRSAYAVSVALGHAPNWLGRVVNGERGITYAGLRSVAAELGVSAGSLVNP